MPLYKVIEIDAHTKVLVWKITETFNELFREVKLKDICLARLEGMKSDLHQRGFLSVRKLLQEAGYTDFDLFYDENGKPHLKDGNSISITHSYQFSAIIISNKAVGIDMELQREKVAIIANKFLKDENSYLDNSDAKNYVKKLIVIWGAKEAIYKMYSKNGLSFKQHINVNSFEMEDNKGTITVQYQEIESTHSCYFEEIENFTLVYTIA